MLPARLGIPFLPAAGHGLAGDPVRGVISTPVLRLRIVQP